MLSHAETQLRSRACLSGLEGCVTQQLCARVPGNSLRKEENHDPLSPEGGVSRDLSQTSWRSLSQRTCGRSAWAARMVGRRCFCPRWPCPRAGISKNQLRGDWLSLGANCLLEIPSCCTCTGFMCVNQQISDLPWGRSVYRVEEEVIALEGFQWSPNLTSSLGLVGFLLSQKWELCGGCQ